MNNELTLNENSENFEKLLVLALFALKYNLKIYESYKFLFMTTQNVGHFLYNFLHIHAHA